MGNDREARWDFQPIDKKHQRNSFDCGYPILNDYLQKYARQNHIKGIAKTLFLKHLAIQCNQGKFQTHRFPIFITLKQFAEVEKKI